MRPSAPKPHPSPLSKKKKKETPEFAGDTVRCSGGEACSGALSRIPRGASAHWGRGTRGNPAGVRTPHRLSPPFSGEATLYHVLKLRLSRKTPFRKLRSRKVPEK